MKVRSEKLGGRFALSLLAISLSQTAYAADGRGDVLDEVTVTSTTIDDRFTGKRGEPASVHNISGQTVDEKRPENMIEILRSIPGVTADLSSGDEIKIKLRGIENQRYMGEKPGVAIVIDGVPVFERTGKVNIDLDNIESIKVIKGGASYLFGEDALSGAVIITTKRGAKYKGFTVSADSGSWNYNRQLVRAGFAGNWGSGHIQATHRAGDDYYFQSAYETNYIDGSLRMFLSDTSDITVNLETSDRAKDKHGSARGATQAEIDPRGTLGRDYTRKYDVKLDKFNVTYSNEYSEKGNILFTGYEYRDHTIFLSAPQTNLISGTLITTATPGYYEAYQNLNDYHQVQRGVKGEWRATADNIGWLGGLDLRKNNYQNYSAAGVDYCKRSTTAAGVTSCSPINGVAQQILKGTVMTNDSTDEEIKALYGEFKHKASEKWVMTVNGRHDNIGLDYHGLPGSDNNQATINKNKSFNINSWRLGANYTAATELNFFGNLSTGFRAPTAEQLYRGSMSPSSGRTANNENLRPERSLNLEFGARNRSEWFGVGMDIEAALFQIDRKDFILASTGQYGGANTTTDIEKYENIGGVRNRGVELSIKSDKKRTLFFDAAYTYLDAYFTKYDKYNVILGNQYSTYVASCGAISAANFANGRNYCLVPYNNTGRAVPRVPKHMLNLAGYWQTTGQLRIGLEMDSQSWSYADEIEQEKLPGRTLFNLSANYDMKESGFLNTKWSFFARINNLFDKRYWAAARAGSGDGKSNLTGTYDGKYNREDLSIVVGKPRNWAVGLTAKF